MKHIRPVAHIVLNKALLATNAAEEGRFDEARELLSELEQDIYDLRVVLPKSPVAKHLN